MENKGNKNSNVIAIVGFILSFFIGIAGLVCSIIGLVKSKELKDGKAFSIAGIIISSLRILLTIFMFILGIIIVISESKDVINQTREGIIERLDEKTEAYNIINNKWGIQHEYLNKTYEYNYIGKYNDQNYKEYYVFEINELDEQIISIGYYAVSIGDNDYYFIMNSPEFLETGIINIEPKVIYSS